MSFTFPLKKTLKTLKWRPFSHGSSLNTWRSELSLTFLQCKGQLWTSRLYLSSSIAVNKTAWRLKELMAWENHRRLSKLPMITLHVNPIPVLKEMRYTAIDHLYCCLQSPFENTALEIVYSAISLTKSNQISLRLISQIITLDDPSCYQTNAIKRGQISFMWWLFLTENWIRFIIQWYGNDSDVCPVLLILF